ncbi:MAG: ASKHA domain-containing protein [Deltaproteobacteria bacterium]|jgi:uncharacterized 2Fe-2S/4Fe-4S cluster protein (DUF4445 family)|nr:ASKHA domain-containing protein [Deltaproteobacteria bacterium]
MRLIVKREGREDATVGLGQVVSLMAALGSAGFCLDAPCGGNGRCGKCLVAATGGLSAMGGREAGLLGGRAGLRLACLAEVVGDAVVTLGPGSGFRSAEGIGWSAPYGLDPPFRVYGLPVRDRRDQGSALGFLGLKGGSLAALRAIGDLEAARNLGYVLAYRDEALMGFAGDGGAPGNLAAALDLGTTGLSAAVLDLGAREIVATGSALNPQTAMGADVVSRVTLAARSAGELGRLQDLAVSGLRDLLASVVGPDVAGKLGGAVVAGNATMIHLLAGVNPKSLAQAPYRPVFTGAVDLSPLAARLGLAPYARVLAAPAISSFVGGDICAGILAVGLRERPGTVMFVDIGTNGEVVLSRDGRLVATSCAMGPALEGMNIERGVRAVTGAVDGFRLNADMSPSFTTIGGAPAMGLCGSGIIDVCAELIKGGLIGKDGRLAKGPSPHVRDGRYHLTEDVFLGQRDIRQVQLAKGAMAAAMKTLLNRLDLTVGDLDEVIVAGSFGFHLRPESLRALRLIPDGYGGPMVFVGNSSLAGAVRLLLDASAMAGAGRLAGEVSVVELGFEPGFQGAFLGELGF